MEQGPGSRARVAWKKFGRDLKQARVQYGSLRHVSAELGIDKGTWSRAENGKPLAAEHLLWLADWAGLDIRLYLAPLYTREH